MCGNASGWSKLALVILIVGLAIHIAGWATMYWMIYTITASNYQINVGLWRMDTCNAGSCEETSVASQYETAAFNAVRAMSTIAFCLAVLTCILLIIYTCADMAKRTTMATVILILLYVAGSCSFVAMVVHITTIPSPFEVSWSMGLTVIAMTLVLIAGTLMIPDAFDDNESYEEEDDDYFGNRRRGDTPTYHRGPPSRGITPLSFKGGFRRY